MDSYTINHRIDHWFRYAHEICETHECEYCPLADNQYVQTDVSVLRCVNGRYKKPKEQTDEQGTGREANESNQAGNDESQK